MLPALPTILLLAQAVACLEPGSGTAQQLPLLKPNDEPPAGISVRLFSHLERLSRLVDIAYCVGTTGLSRPFDCASRCKDFPTLGLVTTWNTGVLMSDSCGYIAIDHGAKLQPESTAGVDGNGDKPGAIIVAFR